MTAGSSIASRMSQIQPASCRTSDSTKPRVDVLVSAEHKHDFVAHDQSMNLMTSVEAAVHKIDQQIRKYKERIIENHRDPEAKRQAPEPAAAEDDAEN